MNHLNLFGYLVDILDKTATWQPNTPLENTEIYYLTIGNHQQKTNKTEQASSLAQFFFVAIREYRYAHSYCL